MRHDKDVGKRLHSIGMLYSQVTCASTAIAALMLQVLTSGSANLMAFGLSIHVRYEHHTGITLHHQAFCAECNGARCALNGAGIGPVYQACFHQVFMASDP